MRPRHGLTILMAGVLVLAAACGDVGARPNNQGNEAYEQEDYRAAQSSYQEAIEKSPELPEPHYNSGNVHYRQGQNEEAQESYDRALMEADEDLYRDILFNQGSIHLQNGEIEEAIESYKEVLRLDPTEEAAKYNLEVALGRQGDQQPGDQQPNTQPQPGSQQPDQQPQPGGQPPNTQPQPGGQPPNTQPQPGNQPPNTQPQPGNQPPDTQPQTTPTTELTPEQARQLLEGVGDQTDTLQNQLQRQRSDIRQPEQNW